MAIEKPSIISKLIIKPSSPTPDHLRIYNLSLVDRLAPHFYMPVVFFYSKVASESSWNDDNISSHLKKSLSETLTQYYPFAGRLSAGNDFIDCNDEGLRYYEARIDCRLDDVVKQPEPSTMDLFSPQSELCNESFHGSPFIVQVTYFSCGGIAITGAILHKVGDACAYFGFIKDWVTVACGGKVSPAFISSLISPFSGQITLPAEIKFENDKIVTRRFSFDASKIAELKAIVADSGVQNPTRVQVVSALIYKCATAAAAKEKSGTSGPSILMQTANLRPLVVPPLPENSVGNFSWFFSVLSKDDRERKLHTIVNDMKKHYVEFHEKYARDLTVDDCYSLVCESIQASRKVLRASNNNDIVVYRCSSLCRYSFTEMNFGWGKPVLVGTFAPQIKNTFHLLDSMEPGGIDAIISLEPQEMAVFEIDEFFLRFAAKY